jgi:hypothetical protein
LLRFLLFLLFLLLLLFLVLIVMHPHLAFPRPITWPGALCIAIIIIDPPSSSIVSVAFAVSLSIPLSILAIPACTILIPPCTITIPACTLHPVATVLIRNTTVPPRLVRHDGHCTVLIRKVVGIDRAESRRVHTKGSSSASGIVRATLQEFLILLLRSRSLLRLRRRLVSMHWLDNGVVEQAAVALAVHDRAFVVALEPKEDGRGG